MPHKIGILTPMLAGLMRILPSDYVVVSRADYDSDAAMAAAHPDLTALVVIGGQPLPHETVEAFPNLKLLAGFGVGYDGIDVAHANARGIDVTNCPNVNNEDVADHALGLFLALVRQIVAGHQRVIGPGWTNGDRGGMWPSLYQLKAGIVGMGAIGRSIAKRLPVFGVQVSWWGPNPKPDLDLPRADSVLELAKSCDVLFMAGRADDSSRGIISAEVIEALGPGGYLINVSRGFTVDEDALITALKTKKLAGAGLDVFIDEPTPPARWADVPNVALTPHIGGGGRGAIEAQTRLVLANLAAFFAGEPLPTPIRAG